MLEKFLKKSSWTDIVVSVIFIIFGAMIIASPGAIMSIISIVLGGICIVVGVLRAIDYFSTNKQDNYLLAIAIVAVIAGIIIMFCADIIASAFRIIIGIWIIYSGIMNLQTTIVWKDTKSKVWYCSLILAIATIGAGIYILVNSGAILEIIGSVIVAYGIINIIENFIFIRKIDNYMN